MDLKNFKLVKEYRFGDGDSLGIIEYTFDGGYLRESFLQNSDEPNRFYRKIRIYDDVGYLIYMNYIQEGYDHEEWRRFSNIPQDLALKLARLMKREAIFSREDYLREIILNKEWEKLKKYANEEIALIENRKKFEEEGCYFGIRDKNDPKKIIYPDIKGFKRKFDKVEQINPQWLSHAYFFKNGTFGYSIITKPEETIYRCEVQLGCNLRPYGAAWTIKDDKLTSLVSLIPDNWAKTLEKELNLKVYSISEAEELAEEKRTGKKKKKP
ncbi:MAG: hypothetical protein GX931_01745 [Acholeplasmataceae bacterium]|jgi:hypothetical protein|nr:hypothetical protein [Acholeplasmataceae bacterium]